LGAGAVGQVFGDLGPALVGVCAGRLQAGAREHGAWRQHAVSVAHLQRVARERLLAAAA